MACSAIGLDREITIEMAILAFEIAMCFIQLQVGDSMLEISLVPAAMAGVTSGVEFADHLACGMTGPTR